MNKRTILYISCVPFDGNTGQNTFEKQMYDLFNNGVNENIRYKAFVAYESNIPRKHGSNINAIRIKKSSIGFVLFQMKVLFLFLKGFLKGDVDCKQSTIFVRYHPSMFVPVFISKLFGINLVIRTGPIIPNLYIYKKNPGKIKLSFIRFFLSLHLNRAKRIIVVTEEIQQWVLDYINCSKDKVKIVPNGVDTRFFHEHQNLSQGIYKKSENETLGIFVGNIYEDQGLDTLIDACVFMKKHTNYNDQNKYLIVGDGVDLIRLKNRVISQGLSDKFVFTGALPHNFIPSLLWQADFSLAPFNKRTFSVTGSAAIKLIESLSVDLPVIASRGPGHEFVEDYKLGFLFEPECYEQLANILNEPKCTKYKLEGRGRDYVENHKSQSNMLNKIVEICIER